MAAERRRIADRSWRGHRWRLLGGLAVLLSGLSAPALSLAAEPLKVGGLPVT